MKATIADINELRPLFLALKKERARGALDVLGCVLVEAEEAGFVHDGRVRFIATDLDHTKIYAVPADVEIEGSVCVDLLDLDKIINKLRKFDGAITVTNEDENDGSSFVEFQHPNLTFRLSGTHPDDFPDVVTYVDSEDPAHVLDADAFGSALASCAIAMSADDSRSNICGVFLEGEHVVSTDGHRLRKIVLEGAHFPGVIVPACAVNALVYALKKFPAETIDFRCGDKWASFSFGDQRVTARLIEGTFPDFTRALPGPEQTEGTLIAERKEMIKSIDAISIIASDKTNNVRLSFCPDSGAELYASDPDTGEGKSPIAGYCEGKPVKAGFNFGYLKDVLKDLESDQVSIELIDTLSPCTIRECDEDGQPDDSGDVWIVMPMRL